MYGEEAKDGVIIIETKKNANKKAFTSNEQNSDNHIDIRERKTDNNYVYVSSHSAGSPLFIIDGKKVFDNSSELKNIDPKNIESIDVLKSKEAEEQYGDEAKNGVVIIKTKNADT